jgi:hypothetical protein
LKLSLLRSRLRWLFLKKKLPFPGLDTREGQGDRARVFEAQLAASLWPQRINRADPDPTLPDHPLQQFSLLKTFTAGCKGF